jgi:hypothetical protein
MEADTAIALAGLIVMILWFALEVFKYRNGS